MKLQLWQWKSKTGDGETLFTRAADWISEFMGTPLNIGIWVVLVAIWFLLFGFNILNENTSFLPAWFTSNAFNFPLNSITTLAELYIGFLIAAASNRVEKRNRELHIKMMELLQKEESEVEELLKK